MNIDELRSGNLVSYKGYQCEVKFIDTFRKQVYIDLTQHRNVEIFKDELKESSILESSYVVVCIVELNPIAIDDELSEKLKIDDRKILEYLSDRVGHYKTYSKVRIRWDESVDFETMQNVFIIDIDEIEVGAQLEFIRDYMSCRFEIPNIRYIHQVQNLYFTLTGKEL